MIEAETGGAVLLPSHLYGGDARPALRLLFTQATIVELQLMMRSCAYERGDCPSAMRSTVHALAFHARSNIDTLAALCAERLGDCAVDVEGWREEGGTSIGFPLRRSIELMGALDDVAVAHGDIGLATHCAGFFCWRLALKKKLHKVG